MVKFSVHTLFSLSTNSLSNIFLQIGPSLKSLQSSGTADGSDGKSMAQVFTKIGFYKGTKVAIRKVDRGPIILSRDNLLELKAVSSQITML